MLGYETIMMNCNPETVSTDYDTSSRLYFEPITVEDVLNVIEAERPEGIIVQFGGQTPLKIAMDLDKALKANPIPAASGERACVRACARLPACAATGHAVTAASAKAALQRLLLPLSVCASMCGAQRPHPVLHAAYWHISNAMLTRMWARPAYAALPTTHVRARWPVRRMHVWGGHIRRLDDQAAWARLERREHDVQVCVCVCACLVRVPQATAWCRCGARPPSPLTALRTATAGWSC